MLFLEAQVHSVGVRLQGRGTFKVLATDIAEVPPARRIAPCFRGALGQVALEGVLPRENLPAEVALVPVLLDAQDVLQLGVGLQGSGTLEVPAADLAEHPSPPWWRLSVRLQVLSGDFICSRPMFDAWFAGPRA